MTRIFLILCFFYIPFVEAFNPKFYGEWSLWHSKSKNILLSNKVIVSLYPVDKFELIEKKSIGLFNIEYIYTGSYSVSYEKNLNFVNMKQGTVICKQKKMKIKLLSFCGIGLDELPIFYMKNLNSKIRLHFDIINKDDIFLSKYDNYFHLVRHTRFNEPMVNIPFSSFLFTNLLGIYLNYLIHKYVHLADF
jgi:hypothetical protein